MPLSKPTNRNHLHSREIQCRGFKRDDGLWDIEGSIIDTKTYSFNNIDRGSVGAGEPVHYMAIRLTLDDGLLIHAAEAVTEASPYRICGNITPTFERLKGLTIGAGWRKEVMRLMGGVIGCTHLRDLLIGPLAVTAMQTVIAAHKRRHSADETTKPPIIDSCYAYATDGPIVERQWPQHHVGKKTGE